MAEANNRPVFGIDGQDYPVDQLPDGVRMMVGDLLRISQEIQELQYRLRHMQAAQQVYVNSVRSEIQKAGIQPLPKNGPDTGAPIQPA
jgi:hypothetical protein